MLLDINDPARLIGKTGDPLWESDADFEISGFVPRVVFPTGIVVRNEIVQLFYGAADTHTEVAEFPLSDCMSLIAQ
jgi:predicted GH43/DUF377 family glycosyl hydrolase